MRRRAAALVGAVACAGVLAALAWRSAAGTRGPRVAIASVQPAGARNAGAAPPDGPQGPVSRAGTETADASALLDVGRARWCAPRVRCADQPDDTQLWPAHADVDRRQRREVVLEVVSRSSRAPLHGVTVRHRGAAFVAPAEHEAADAAGDSPLAVAPPADGPRVSTVEVACEGHVPRLVALDWGCGGSRAVVLEAAGALEVELVGAREGETCVVRGHPLDAGADAITPASDRHAIADALGARSHAWQRELRAGAPERIGGLHAGRWRVALYAASLPAAPMVDVADCRVEGGAVESLAFVARPPVPRPAVRFAGEIVLDPVSCTGLARVPLRLRCRQTDRGGLEPFEKEWQARIDAGRAPDRFQFDAGELFAGEIELSLESDFPADLAHLAARTHICVVPAGGDVAAQLAWPGWSDVPETAAATARGGALRLHSGASRSRFRRITITLYDGDATVPWEPGFRLDLVRPDLGELHFDVSPSRRDPGVSATVLHDGAIDVAVDGVPDYLPVEPFRIDLSTGSAFEVEIPLRRRN